MEFPVDSPLLQDPLKMVPDLVETPVAEQPQTSEIRSAIRISEAGNDNGDNDNVVLFDAGAVSRSSRKSSMSMDLQTEAAQNAVEQNELPVLTYDDSHIVEEEEEEHEGQAERRAPNIMNFDAFVTGELSFLPAANESEVVGSECEEDNLTESRDDDNEYSQCTLGTPDDEEEVDFDYDTFKDAFDGDGNYNDNDDDDDGDQPAPWPSRVSLTSISSKLVLGVKEKTQQVAQSKKQALSNFQKKGGLVSWLHGELPDGSSDPDYYDDEEDGMDESSGTTTQPGALPQVAPGIPSGEDALRPASLPSDPIASPSSQQKASSRQYLSFRTQQHQQESAPAMTTFLKKSLGRQRAGSLLENLYGKVKKSASLSPAATPPRSPTRSGGSGGDRSLPDSPASAGSGGGRIALQPSPRKESAKGPYSFGFEDFDASDVKDGKASGVHDHRQRTVSADNPPPKSAQQQVPTRTQMSWSLSTSVPSPVPSPEPISAIRETRHLLLHECLADPKLAAEFVNTVMPDDSALLKLLYSIEEYEALVTTTMTTSGSVIPALSVQVMYATTVIDKFLISQPNSTMFLSSSALSKLPASTPTDLKYTIEQFQLANTPTLPKSLFKDVYKVVYDALRDGYEAFRSTREYALLLEQQAFQHERGVGLNTNNNGNNGNNVMTLDAILKSEWCCTVFWMHLYRTAHHHRLSFLMEKAFKLDRLYQEFLETRELKVPADVGTTAGASASAIESYSRLIAQLKLMGRKFLHTTAPVALPVAAVSLCRLKEEICVEITHLPLSSALHQGDGNDNDCVAAIERVMGKLDAFAFDVQKEFKRLSFERFASFTASSLYRDFISQLLQPPSVGSQAEMGVEATVRGDIVQLLRASRIPFHQAPNEAPQVLDLSSLLGTPDGSSSSSSMETESASDAIYKVFSFVKRDVVNAQKRTQPYEFVDLMDNGGHKEAVNEEQKPSQDALLYQMVEHFLIPEAAPRTFQISDAEAQQRLCFNFVAGNSENSVYGAVWRTPLVQSDGITTQGICVLSKYPLVDSLRHYLWRFARRKMHDGANSATASGVLGGNLSSALDEANAAFETYFAGQHQQIPTQPIMETNNSGELQALPRVDFSLEDLFDCLSITHILRLVSFVLLEKKIVLVSSSYSVLLSVGEALKSLIYPLAWSHIYVPVLPLALKGYLHCPTPFIFGLHNSYVRNSELPRPSDDLVVVNLDRDSLTGGGDVFLPPTRNASIRDKLTRICRPRLQTRDQIDFYPGGESESLSSKDPVKPKVFPSQAIRSMFHEELREMLSGLEMFAFRFEFNDKFVTVVDSSNKSRAWTSDSLRFNATLLQTQAFSAHLSSLSNFYRTYPRVNCIAPSNIIVVGSECKIEPRRMSLLCDYSDSSSASSDDDDEQATAPQLTPAVARAQQQISLPSAEELFASDTSLSLTSSNNISTQYTATSSSSSSSASGFVGSTGQNDVAKRRLQEQELSAAKRLKPTTTSGSNSSNSIVTTAKKPMTHFAPPQLKRPNVSTEDLGAWNTQKTLAMQRKAKSQHADL